MPLALSSPLLIRQPGRLHFGAGCAREAAAQLAAAGYRRALILTSPPVLAHAEAFAAPLRSAGATVEFILDVPAEPTTAASEAIRGQAARFAPDLVIGLGGGSVLDVAKLIAVLHDKPEPATQFYGIGLAPARTTALVCVPTTAGTGSEVSPNALLFDEVAAAKKAIIGPPLMPDVAVVDPALTLTLPASLTATTGIDALTHCLEAYANKVAHPLIDLYALEGVRLIATHLPRAVADGGNLEARSAVALGSLYGGICLGPVNTTGVHALAYPLGGEFHLPHGLSIALMLPHVVRFNLSALPERHAALAAALGGREAEELPGLLLKLIADCRVPMGLGRHGIARDAIPRLVTGGLAVTRLLKNNPREVTAADATAIYEQAFTT